MKQNAELAKISQGLEIFEAKKTEFETIAEKSKHLVQVQIDDKAGLEIVYQHRQVLKKARIEIEKQTKELCAIPRTIEAQIRDKSKELLEIIVPEEDRLQEIEENVEREKKALAELEKKKHLEKFQERIHKIAQVSSFDGWFFNIGEFIISKNELEFLDDVNFEFTLSDFAAEFEKQQKIKAEQEQAQRIELERLRKEKEENDRKEAEMRAKEAELKKRIEEIERKEAEIKRQQEEHERRVFEQKVQDNIRKIEELTPFKFIGDYFVYLEEGLFIGPSLIVKEEISNLSEERLQKLIIEANKKAALIDKQYADRKAEKERLEKEQAEKIAAKAKLEKMAAIEAQAVFGFIEPFLAQKFNFEGTEVNQIITGYIQQVNELTEVVKSKIDKYK